MPAHEVDCQDCPDDNGTGVVASGEEFEVRIGNKILSFVNGELSLNDVINPIANGTYTRVTINNGQIIDADDQAMTYTPEDCCPTTGGDTGGGTALPVSSDPANLLKVVSGAYLVKPTFANTPSVVITGDGTAANPWKAAVQGGTSSSGALIAGQCISLSNTTLGQRIAHGNSTVGVQTFMGVTYDICGHPTSFDAGVNSNVDDEFTLGGFTITINDEGRITNIVGAGSNDLIEPGNFISSAITSTSILGVTTTAPFTFSYNEYGIITSKIPYVDETDQGGA